MLELVVPTVYGEVADVEVQGPAGLVASWRVPDDQVRVAVPAPDVMCKVTG